MSDNITKTNESVKEKMDESTAAKGDISKSPTKEQDVKSSDKNLASNEEKIKNDDESKKPAATMEVGAGDAPAEKKDKDDPSGDKDVKKPADDDAKKTAGDDVKKAVGDDVKDSGEDDVKKPDVGDVKKPAEDDVKKPAEDDVKKPAEDVKKPAKDDVKKPAEDDVKKPADDDIKKPAEDDVKKPTEDNVKDIVPEEGAKESENEIKMDVDTKVEGVENGVEKMSTDEVSPAVDGEITDVDKRIVKQLLYYFGDINMPKDRFLQEQTALDEGWVPISVLVTFKRLAALSTDTQVIANALIKSEQKLLEVNADRTKIRRSPDFPVPELTDERKKELMDRTAYVKGFPIDIKLEVLQEFFEPYGPVESIHMRYNIDKAENKHTFKGSVFVIFESVDVCKKFVELKEVKYKDKALIHQWQVDFIEEKKKERRPKDKEDTSKAAKDSESEAVTFPKASVLHMNGLNKKTTRDHIKKALTQLEHVPAYIAFQKGDEEAWARFQEKDEASAVLEKLDNAKLKINGTDVTVRVLEGEEEEQYFKEAAESMSKKKTRGASKWKGKRRGGAGGDGATKSKRSRR